MVTSVANKGRYILQVEPATTNPGNLGKFVRVNPSTNANPNDIKSMSKVCFKA